MVESTCFQHTSSHPDKYNNSVDRIISKEEEREDPRRELQLSSSTVVFPQIIQERQDFFEYSVFCKNYSVSTRSPATPSFHKLILCAELILFQEVLQLQGSSRTGSFQQLFPVSPSILHGRIQP